MNRDFFKYIVCALAVIAGVAVVDKVAGAGMDRLQDAVPVTQDIGKGRFAINEVETDVVIVGSSRAAHHYVSTMIADSLGCSVYNVGRDGCFFSDNLCVTNAILDRYSPKMIVLEVANNCLDENARTNPEAIFPYYWESDYTKQVIDSDVGWKANIQMLSTLYRYNAISFKTIGYGLKGLVSEKSEDQLMGYTPIAYIERRSPMELKETEVSSTSTISDLKCKQLENLLKKAKTQDVEMILICSPMFRKATEDDNGKKVLMKLCDATGTAYYDYSAEQTFLNHPEWFNDGTHLNCKGAEVFTKMILEGTSINNLH